MTRASAKRARRAAFAVINELRRSFPMCRDDRTLVRAMAKAEMQLNFEQSFARSLWHQEGKPARLGDGTIKKDALAALDLREIAADQAAVNLEPATD